MGTQLRAAVEGVFAARQDQPLAEWVAEQRGQTPPVSWRRIAEQLRLMTDGAADVSHVTLIDWYGDRAAA